MSVDNDQLGRNVKAFSFHLILHPIHDSLICLQILTFSGGHILMQIHCAVNVRCILSVIGLHRLCMKKISSFGGLRKHLYITKILINEN